ncbi:MAG: hypothetical protein ACJAUV_001251 [Flavobacteriales bacterium]|jgi:hypothetical protein
MKTRLQLIAVGLMLGVIFTACEKESIETPLDKESGPSSLKLAEAYHTKMVAVRGVYGNSNIAELTSSGNMIYQYNVSVNIGYPWEDYRYDHQSIAVSAAGDIYLCAKSPGGKIYIFRGEDELIERPSISGSQILQIGKKSLYLTRLYEVTSSYSEFRVTNIEIKNGVIYGIGIANNDPILFNLPLSTIGMSQSITVMNSDLSNDISSLNLYSDAHHLSLATINSSLYITYPKDGRIYSVSNSGSISLYKYSTVYMTGTYSPQSISSCGISTLGGDFFANAFRHGNPNSNNLNFRLYDVGTDNNIDNTEGENMLIKLGAAKIVLEEVGDEVIVVGG